MNDPTPHGNDLTVYDLLSVIEDAIEASPRFTREDGIGDWRCMTLVVRTAGGPELTVSVANPEQCGD